MKIPMSRLNISRSPSPRGGHESDGRSAPTAAPKSRLGLYFWKTPKPVKGAGSTAASMAPKSLRLPAPQSPLLPELPAQVSPQVSQGEERTRMRAKLAEETLQKILEGAPHRFDADEISEFCRCLETVPGQHDLVMQVRQAHPDVSEEGSESAFSDPDASSQDLAERFKNFPFVRVAFRADWAAPGRAVLTRAEALQIAQPEQLSNTRSVTLDVTLDTRKDPAIEQRPGAEQRRAQLRARQWHELAKGVGNLSESGPNDLSVGIRFTQRYKKSDLFSRRWDQPPVRITDPLPPNRIDENMPCETFHHLMTSPGSKLKSLDLTVDRSLVRDFELIVAGLADQNSSLESFKLAGKAVLRSSRVDGYSAADILRAAQAGNGRLRQLHITAPHSAVDAETASRFIGDGGHEVSDLKLRISTPAAQKVAEALEARPKNKPLRKLGVFFEGLGGVESDDAQIGRNMARIITRPDNGLTELQVGAADGQAMRASLGPIGQALGHPQCSLRRLQICGLRPEARTEILELLRAASQPGCPLQTLHLTSDPAAAAWGYAFAAELDSARERNPNLQIVFDEPSEYDEDEDVDEPFVEF